MSGRFMGTLIVLDDGFVFLRLPFYFGMYSAKIKSGACRSPSNVIALVPVLGPAPDDAADLVKEGEAVSCLFGGAAKTREPVNMRLIWRSVPGGWIDLNRVRTGPTVSQPLHLGDAGGIAQQIGDPLRMHMIEELRLAHCQWIDRTGSDHKIIPACQLNKPGRRQVGIGTAK